MKKIKMHCKKCGVISFANYRPKECPNCEAGERLLNFSEEGTTARFVFDPESGFVRDTEKDEWLTTAQEVFEAMHALCPNTETSGR